MENHHATFHIEAKILNMEKACFVGLLQSVSNALIVLLFFLKNVSIFLAGNKIDRILFLFIFLGGN